MLVQTAVIIFPSFYVGKLRHTGDRASWSVPTVGMRTQPTFQEGHLFKWANLTLGFQSICADNCDLAKGPREIRPSPEQAWVQDPALKLLGYRKNRV